MIDVNESKAMSVIESEYFFELVEFFVTEVLHTHAENGTPRKFTRAGVVKGKRVFPNSQWTASKVLGC